MAVSESLLAAIDPEATWSETACVCGQVVRVPSALTGREGTCPGCLRPFVTPGSPAEHPRAGGVFDTYHPERELKRLAFEPCFADRESEYAAAQRNAIIPGMLYLLATVGVAQFVVSQPSLFETAIGLPVVPRWIAPVWLLALWAVSATFLATAVGAFRFVAARTYTTDRVAFAAAGGYDVARWVPMLMHAGLFLCCAVTRNPGGADRLAALRNPWTFLLIGAGIGHASTWLAAWWVFHCRFERPH